MGHFTTNFASKADKVFSITSARMRSISKTDSHVDRSILAIVTAYQECLLSNVQIGDVIRGTMAAPPNAGKSRV